MKVDFGGRFAYNANDAQPGKSVKENKMKKAKKPLKKAKKLEATKPLLAPVVHHRA